MIKKIKIIDFYLGKSTMQGFLLSLLLLVVLFSFFELLIQMNSVGKGSFRMADAFTYVALTVPKRMADLMPMAALLGSIVALGLLADHQELTAMQAAGISVQHISAAVLATSVLLMFISIFVSEFIAPSLDQQARILRSQAIYGNEILLTKHGFWVRHGSSFIHVGETLSKENAANIEIFEFEPTGLLRKFIYAKQGHIQKNNEWLLTEVEAVTIDGETMTQKNLPDYSIKDFLRPSQVAVLKLPPDSLSLSDLYKYIGILQKRGLNTEAYSLAFWQKICLPVTTAVMVLLSLTFIFGSTRIRNAWQRIFRGMLVGVIFYLSSQLFNNLGLILHLPSIVTTLLPVCIILVVSLRLLRRAF